MENEMIVSGGDVLQTETPESVSVYATNVYLISETDIEQTAVGSGSGYQLPEYYVNFFSGLLANMPDTEYVAFCERIYDGNSNYNYTDHYYLVHGLTVENNAVVQGNYPAYHIVRSSSNSSYYTLTETTYYLSSYPSLSYGSVVGTSDLRKGVTHYESLALLLTLSVISLFIIIRGIFGSIRKFRR